MGIARWFKWLFRNPQDFRPEVAAGRIPAAVIRKLIPEDIDACCEIFLKNEPEHFPDGYFEEFKASLTSPSHLWLVVVVEGQVIGVGAICLDSNDGRLCHLSFGMITPDRQRQGFGSALLLARLAALPEPDLFSFVCMAPVANSVSYYERFGFEPLGRLRVAGRREKSRVSISLLKTTAWTACAALLSASGVEIALDQLSVPKRSGRK